MKIVKLEAKNILRLDAVEINPDGSVIVIGGMNGQGKTSVLDSIVLAMGGRAAKHSRPLKDGADRGEIEIELDDLLVRRTFTKKGTALRVTTKDGGATYSSPQKILDALVGQLTFDPLAWSSMDSRKQVEILKEMVGLDFSDMNAKRKEYYDERTVKNRQFSEQKTLLDSLPDFSEVPDEEISFSELFEEKDRRSKINDENSYERKRIDVFERSIEKQEEEYAYIAKRLFKLKEELQTLSDSTEKKRKEIEETQSNMDSQKQLVSTLADEDEQEILDLIAKAEQVNKQVRAKEQRNKQADMVDELRSEVERLTQVIAEYDTEKETQLKQAEFPIAGLAFDDSEVLYKGVPFRQCSSAERLRVSVAMGLAMNPKLKVLLIRDGSLLDENNLKIITEMVREKDAQIWIERVGKGEECSVIIEDGKVQALNELF